MSMSAAIGERAISRRMLSEQASERAFFAISALLFFVSAAITIIWCGSMSAMGDMPMPGGWTNVDGMDADARTDVARSGGIFPRHVGRDDGGDDAAILDGNALALSSDCREHKRSAFKPVNRVGGHGVLLRMDSDRYRRLPYWRRAGHD